MKILVTGVAGFIGFHTAKRLLEQDYTVIGLDNLNDYYDVALKEARLQELSRHPMAKNFTFIKLDISDGVGLQELFAQHNFTYVVHLAAQAGVRYSPLKQINDQNVKDLKVAWTLRTGDLKTDNDSGETTNQVTPIKIGNNMFICTAHQQLIAIDPATGKEKWRFDPKLKTDKSFQHLTCRGVMYYDANNTTEFATSLQSKKSSSTQCPRKVFVPVNDGRLVAVNADTGKACTDFGQNGQVNLQEFMPYAYPGGYNPTSPGIVTGSTVVIAGSVTDNYSNKEPSGVIRGYDVNTGKLLWVFDTGAADPNAMPLAKYTQPF